MVLSKFRNVEISRCRNVDIYLEYNIKKEEGQILKINTLSTSYPQGVEISCFLPYLSNPL